MSWGRCVPGPSINQQRRAQVEPLQAAQRPVGLLLRPDAARPALSNVAKQPLLAPGWQPHLPAGKAGLEGLAGETRFIPLRNHDGARGAAYEDSAKARDLIHRLHAKHPAASERVFIAPRNQMQSMWGQALRGRLTAFAQNHLLRVQPHMSAQTTLTRAQKRVFVLLTAGLLAWSVLALPSVLVLLHVAFASLYMSVGVARFYAVFAPPPTDPYATSAASRGSDQILPTYSVMIPLYDEAAMIPGLVAAMRALDYPADKLDILILVEGDDAASLQALAQHRLPDFISVIKVPPSKPRTKPKALMFGLPLTRGTYVTIYDAEDRPEPDQLRKAVAAFATGSLDERASLGCVQAALNITNGRCNFLTRHFELEYMALFDVFLPALTRLDLPIPLGGTSNHFRRQALLHSGGWDPYNVTEDADLGIRLARLGYTTKMIASTTFERAPSRFKPWVKQRARWFKGWWQTWLVHMRTPLHLMAELGPVGFLAFQVIMLGVLISVLIHPFFLLATLVTVSGLFEPPAGGSTTGEQVLLTFSLTSMVLGYLAAIGLAMVGAERRRAAGTLWVLLTIPLYWIYLSVAGFLALWELMWRPHHWNKTPHAAED